METAIAKPKRARKSAAPASVAAAEAADLQQTMQKNQVQTDGPAAPPNGAPTPAPAKDDKKAKADKKPKPQRIETIFVRHDFTVQEKADLGGVLADKARVMDAMKSEAKVCARQYKDKIDTMQGEIDKVVDKIKEGFEMIEVDAIAMVQIDQKAKTATKAYYRKDTGEFIRSENVLSNTELPLFNILPAGVDMSKPLGKKLMALAV